MEIPSRPAQSQLSCAVEAAVARHALSCAEKKKKKKVYETLFVKFRLQVLCLGWHNEINPSC